MVMHYAIVEYVTDVILLTARTDDPREATMKTIGGDAAHVD
jgi:hypothetical protein